MTASNPASTDAPSQGPVYLRALGAHVPEGRISNARFEELTGNDADWFVARTGIHTRSRAAPGETTSSMAIAAVRTLLDADPQVLDGVDLIIGASYTPDDTLSTMAARVQRAFAIEQARVYFISTACTSWISALELAELMINSGVATRALVVVAEHNSRYSDDADRFSGHLWGDGAAATVLTTRPEDALFSLDYVRSRGLACAGLGPEAITLTLDQGDKGLVMSGGRDVFARACEYLVEEIRDALGQTGRGIEGLDWLVPHQANHRILVNVARTLDLPSERVVVTVDTLGNTGCASIPISLASVLDQVKSGQVVVGAAFGGGYSAGAVTLTRL